MDVRTKLALALVATSLVAMFVLGTFAYETTNELLRQDSERRLDALAESKQRDLDKVLQSWRDRVDLIRSRTRLRMLVDALSEKRDPTAVEEIRGIVHDALGAVRGVERITLFDRLGRPVVSVGEGITRHETGADSPGSARIVEAVVGSDGRVAIRLLAALERDGATIGSLEAWVDPSDLADAAEDYTGLGETGETTVFQRNADGQLLPLTGLRHVVPAGTDPRALPPCALAALEGEESVLREGIRDYRGEPVWCATRRLAETGWGLVVKIDEAEELARGDWLRDQLTDLGLALGALAILGGTLLGMHLGKPLRDLTAVVERVRAGDSELRADDSAADEVGFLARALNELLDERDPR